MEAYAVWNNKGGTGKSTITFHIASRFAELHPKRNILVIDLCPQANASMLLLGGGLRGEANLLSLCSKATPQSVVGYISECILKRSTPDVSSYYVQARSINKMMPSNLYLLSGDGNLELMAPAINDEASRTPFPGLADPWRWVHEIFVRLRLGLSKDEWTLKTHPGSHRENHRLQTGMTSSRVILASCGISTPQELSPHIMELPYQKCVKTIMQFIMTPMLRSTNLRLRQALTR